MFIHVLRFIYNFSCHLKVFVVGNSRIVIGVLCSPKELASERCFVVLSPMIRNLDIWAISRCVG